MRDLINQMKCSQDANYCQRVSADDGELGEQHLRDFQDNEKSIPTILTTSQKLATGVDARNIRNIILMRSINSLRCCVSSTTIPSPTLLRNWVSRTKSV